MEEQSTMTATTSLVAPTAPRRSNAEALDIAHMTVDAASDKKAQDILLLDVSEVAGFTDYFVICSGTSERQIRAVADGIDEALAERGVEPYKREGTPADGWVLLDYFDFIVHVFARETRLFYGLERLWGSAERIEVTAK